MVNVFDETVVSAVMKAPQKLSKACAGLSSVPEGNSDGRPGIHGSGEQDSDSRAVLMKPTVSSLCSQDGPISQGCKLSSLREV